MVTVREQQLATNIYGDVDIDAWLQDLGDSQPEALKTACLLARDLEDAAVAAENIWAKGASSFITGLQMAEILSDLNLDHDSLVAAVLYRAVREGKLSLERVQQDFGISVSKLIDGVLKMAAISSLQNYSRESVLGQSKAQTDHVRRMLVSMVEDVRVALIKLAERTCAIRAVKDAEEKKRKKVAREVFEIYAPLAHRLSIGQLKWELEDLAFRYLEPKAYKHVASLLSEKRMDRQQYIDNVIEKLRAELALQGIDAEVFGRAKHIYSIWAKMQRKRIEFSEVYDVRALRILVPDVKSCYGALGIVHQLWKHIPREFDDYIATPKENGYQSLHTAVLTDNGHALEVQIRTSEMHEEAELGVCAHHAYKKSDTGAGENSSYEAKIAWLRGVLTAYEESGGLADLADELRVGIEHDRIYVFTPEGHVVDLPPRATPLDFAYRVHTEVGHRCRGAKVNGRIVPLSYALSSGEQVHVLTNKEGGPSRNWLTNSLGYLTTSRAKAKVQQYFRLQAKDENCEQGKALLDREFRRLALPDINLAEVAKQFNYPSEAELYAGLGAGDVKAAQVLTVAQKQISGGSGHAQLNLFQHKKNVPSNKKESAVNIVGVGNLLTTMANCCQPVPGDQIIGYVTLGRGVSIHRQDCSNVLYLQRQEPERLLQVSWNDQVDRTYPVEVEVTAYDRSGLLRDITVVLANEQVNVVKLTTESDVSLNTAHMVLVIEVSSLQSLGRVLAKINQLSNVIDVRRRETGSEN